jgi:cyanate lyase
MSNFDAKALYASLDKHRTARGMSWLQVSHVLGLMASTIPEMTAREVLDSNDVLQMTRWLGLNIESFCGSGRDPVRGPQPGDVKSTGRKLRVDTAKLYAALDRKRNAKGLTWEKLAASISSPRVTPAMLAALGGASRVDVRSLLSIVRYLGGHTSSYTRLDALEPIR